MTESPKTPIADEGRSRRTRLVAAFGLAVAGAVAVATAAVGGHVLAAPPAEAAKAPTVQIADAGHAHDGDADWDDESWDEENWDDDSWDDEYEDPFAGMTDAEVDALSDDEFFAMLDGVEDWDGEDWDGDDHDDDHGADDEVLGAFSVDGDMLDTSGAPSAEVAQQSQAIWDRFVQLIPADQRQMLTSLELNPAEAGGAYVYPNDADPSTWTMGVSLGLGEDLDYVLIHEFAHLLTLQAAEVPPAADDEPAACPTYFTGEGCALSGSTMAEFVQRFWPQSQIDEIDRLQNEGDYDALDAFYQANQDDFVTDYATTNAAEDLAETFAVFVLQDRPTGDTIADQKVNLLWADADMVQLREQIRANR